MAAELHMDNQPQENKRPPFLDRITPAVLKGLAAAGFIGIVVGVVLTLRGTILDPVSLTYATWTLALLTLVLAVGVPLTIRESSRQSLKQERDRFYAQLDNTYLQIQRLIIEHPHFAEPENLPSRENATADQRIQLVQYDAFAFATWNFIESIHDFTQPRDGTQDERESIEMLKETWTCILKYEGARHAAWFRDPKNQRKFKEPFWCHINHRLDKWCAEQATPKPIDCSKYPDSMREP
jgi:hypothetical protein